MMFLYYVYAFIFGAIIGSYLNVVILRLNTGKLLGNNHSECLHCGTPLMWYELLPIVSFFFLKRRCRSCYTKISWQYPLVEIFTALLFTLIYWKVSLSVSTFLETVLLLAFFYFIFSNLIVICVYDLRHKIIPDYPLYFFIAAGLIGNALLYIGSNNFFTFFIGDLIGGGLLFLPFYLLWLVSDGAWVGFGDAKLSFGIGIFLGLARGVVALVISFWVGAVVSVLLLIFGKIIQKNSVNNSLFLKLKKLTIKSEIPFAPFLILGTIVSFFYDIGIISLLTFFE